MSNQTPPDSQMARLEPVFAALEKYARGSSRAALMPLDDAVAAANFDLPARLPLEKRLLQSLASGPSKVAREYICSKLSWIGGEASVAALVQLLPDADLCAPARSALEAIGAPVAAKALRKGLTSLPNRQKAGAARSLGALRDEGSVRSLRELLRHSDPEVALASVTALGNIGSTAAARALRAFAPQVPAALRIGYGDAALVCAGHLDRAGQPKEARALCQALTAPEFPEHIRETAARMGHA